MSRSRRQFIRGGAPTSAHFITRQRLHQLRQSGKFPEPDRELIATPLWMRSTLKDFAVGWRRTLEALGQNATSDAMILGAIGLGPYQQKTL